MADEQFERGMLRPSEAEFQLACPVCSAFNPADFRFCPRCGHRLGAPDIVKEASTSRRLFAGMLRPIIVILLLIVVVEMGIDGSLWTPVYTLVSRWRAATSVAPTSDVQHAEREAEESPSPPVAELLEGDAHTRSASSTVEDARTPPTIRQPATTVVELTLFDREGDRLRQGRGLLTSQERRVVTTFETIHGAYAAAVRLPNNPTAVISRVERADVAANLAILSLESLPITADASLPTLEVLARATYEDTPAEQRYMAEKRAMAQRWDEALAHWKQAITLDEALRGTYEAALAEAFLNASAAALQQERRADAHARLLEAVEWLPEHGMIRLRLAESFARLGEYREAIEQYWLVPDLLPAQAAAVANAVARVYRDWGQESLRQGDFAGAANLLREALQLDSTNGGLYFVLGQAEFRRQAFEAAIQALENAIAYEPGLRGEVEPYLAKARALLGGPETLVITFPPGSTRIEIPVVINGRIQLPFIIDTGASMTLIPAWAAEMLGYRPQPTSEWLRVQTAGGPRRLPYASLSRIEIEGLGLSNLPVLFGDLPGYDGSRGLLGMDFLRHFSLAVDHDLGRMTLRLR
ncbi:MAG TPA: aspartyl protease family protein [Candidatus Tectomicrobia bacterium]|nr:aspartyl protease family protein [Candidatus Tectomicrobia bacterium]